MHHPSRKKVSRRHAINRLKMVKRKSKMKVMYKRARLMDPKKKQTLGITQKTTSSNDGP